MDKVIRLIWKCELCNDVVVSYSHLRHEMNFCDCGSSAVDLEKWYQKNNGKVKEISRKENVNGEWKNIKQYERHRNIINTDIIK